MPSIARGTLHLLPQLSFPASNDIESWVSELALAYTVHEPGSGLRPGLF
jgi:hypothetical protein